RRFTPDPPPPAPPKPSRVSASRVLPTRLKPFAAWVLGHRFVSAGSLAAGALATVLVFQMLNPPRVLTQADIDAAVDYTLKHRPQPPSTSSVAAEIIRPSVVRVVGYLPEDVIAKM